MNTLKRLGGMVLLGMAGCHSGTFLDAALPTESLVVSGAPGVVPSRVRSAAVWGNDTRTVTTAITWLNHHGLTVFGPEKLEPLIARHVTRENLLLVQEGGVLEAAKEAGVQAVVFADRVGDSRPPMVSVRGVDARSGRILWSGTARLDSYQQLPSNNTVGALTDQALAAAWGIKPKDDDP